MFYENKLLHMASPETSSNEEVSNPFSQIVEKDLQNEKADARYKNRLEEYNSSWNPIHLGVRAWRSAIGNVIGKEGETLGRKFSRGALRIATLGFAPAALTAYDTFKPNVVGIKNQIWGRVSGVTGHLWNRGIAKTAMLPFGAAFDIAHAGTSGLGAVGNTGVGIAQKLGAIIPGIGNVITKPIAYFGIPGGESLNGAMKGWQDSAWNAGGERFDRAKENIALAGFSLGNTWDRTKDTVLGDADAIARASLSAVGPAADRTVGNFVSDKLYTLNTSHPIERVWTGTGENSSNWVSSNNGKEYEKKHDFKQKKVEYTPSQNTPNNVVSMDDYRGQEIDLTAAQLEISEKDLQIRQLKEQIAQANQPAANDTSSMAASA